MRALNLCMTISLLHVSRVCVLLHMQIACDPNSFTDDAAANFFTANCSAATAPGSTCTITHTASYVGGSLGSVTCDGVTGQYVVQPAGVCAYCTDTCCFVGKLI